MGSSFAGLSTALSGLYSSRQGLDLAGQNVANANTEGYTRQRMNLEAKGAPTTPAFFSTYDGVGSGVGVSGIERLRDSFLESRGHTEHGRNSFLAGRSSAMSQIEDILAEPGDSGLQSQVSELFNAWHDLATSPGDPAARTQLLQRASTVADGLHQTRANFETQWEAEHTQLKALVSEVNTTAGALAELNTAITRNTQAGLPASELADQRDRLIMSLATKVGATVKPGQDGTVDVYVGGTALVRGSTVQKLQVTGAETFEETVDDPTAKVVVSWMSDGYPAAVELGEAASHLDTMNNILPDYAKKLNDFTNELVTQVNDIHRGGFDLANVGNRDFFAGTTADTIAVAVTRDEIAASSVDSGVPGAGVLDGGIADKIAKLASDVNGPAAVYRQTVTQLGVDAQTANRRSSIQETITTQVDASREAQSGVDLDEEMTNLLAFQHAYEGAARVLTAIDEALDTLINRTGLVGR